jgi:quinolinate synthase
MKKNTLEKVWLALRDEVPEITIPEDVRAAAQKSLDRMLELS